MQSQSSADKAREQIVIVGAGPIGLYTAIELKKKGVNQVTVVDPEIESHYRPGFIGRSVFKLMEDHLKKGMETSLAQPVELPYSEALHVKELERGLETLAKNCGVVLRKAAFESFSQNKMTIKLAQSDTREEIPCDLTFDATGSARVLIKAINQQEKFFKLKAVGDNPLENNFIAYVKMEAEQAFLVQQGAQLTNDLNYVIGLETLRQQFGWEQYDHPLCLLVSMNEAKNKVCLYYETPPNLEAKDYEAWLKALLKMRTGEEINFELFKAEEKLAEDEQYKIRKNKLRFSPFLVSPKEASPSFYPGKEGLPMTILVGDALLEPDYQAGVGISAGVARVDALLSGMTVSEGKITAIDFDAYHEKIKPLMEAQKEEIVKNFEERDRRLQTALDLAESRYQKALELAAEQEQPLIKEGFNELQRLKFYNAATQGYSDAILDGNAKFKLKSGGVERLERSLDDYVAALSFTLAPKDKPFYEKINSELAGALSGVGPFIVELAKNKKYLMASKYNAVLLNFYKKYYPNAYLQEQQMLANNQAIFASRIKEAETPIAGPTSASSTSSTPSGGAGIADTNDSAPEPSSKKHKNK